jgi:hypothetical protein
MQGGRLGRHWRVKRRPPYLCRKAGLTLTTTTRPDILALQPSLLASRRACVRVVNHKPTTTTHPYNRHERKQQQYDHDNPALAHTLACAQGRVQSASNDLGSLDQRAQGPYRSPSLRRGQDPPRSRPCPLPPASTNLRTLPRRLFHSCAGR